MLKRWQLAESLVDGSYLGAADGASQKNTVGLMDVGRFEMISDGDLLGCPVKNMFPKS